MRSGRTLALATALALLAYGAARGRLRRYEISEGSMEPKLRSGDYVIAQVRKGPVNRGDIVIVDHPWVPSFEIVKRVVGLPGESVVVTNGQVHINGNVLAEAWADGPTHPDGSWELQTDEVFVLGDSRAASAADSRTIGPVSLASAGWKVVARYWPLGSIGGLSI